MAEGSAGSGGRVPRYRRRRPLPALILLAILGVLAGYVWTQVLAQADDIEAATRCNPPSALATEDESEPAPEPGDVRARDALDRTDPLPPEQVRVSVVNASGARNQATLVATELADFGFAQENSPANDPVYPAEDMACYGQIRYGQNSAGMARTLSLAVPCAELVDDGREGQHVDLAVGDRFTEVSPNAHTREIFDVLAGWQMEQTGDGGEQSEGGGEGEVPEVSDELLTAARDVHC
ncbi:MULTISPECIES: envelope integrity protein Cei [Actinoalloteichus]|uniref:LytR cell envelope-related transcriptional attenuator n=1 Tax=Actinoalloteichus fjordicus TaxID=1612552 RepID=A0AAC9LA40_9PSEU|nr:MULTISPECIES: envelope integrity protein Cei [Actinoalloteichus]APU13756.1 LytR cell envelope-related transcriptional attenuator [Actinoalloteichus fjordicus]APU19701.1 LytR cell envelope-related transcriptional attenuator [Actinoalloteichus sp. GBA129-24]